MNLKWATPWAAAVRQDDSECGSFVLLFKTFMGLLISLDKKFFGKVRGENLLCVSHTICGDRMTLVKRGFILTINTAGPFSRINLY